MRSWIYNLIVNMANLGSIKDRVVSSAATEEQMKALAKPFMIISMGADDLPVDSTTDDGTFNQMVDVYVHDAPGSWNKIDDACVVLKRELPQAAPAVVGGLSVYQLKYLETSNDATDDMLGTNFRRVTFQGTCRR